jgi:hypothetical protein
MKSAAAAEIHHSISIISFSGHSLADAGLLRHHLGDAERPFPVEKPLLSERAQLVVKTGRHWAALCPTGAEARTGSKIWLAMNRTTGTDTRSPAR